MKNSLTINMLKRFNPSGLLVLFSVCLLLQPVFPAKAEDKISITVSILPQVWFVQQIGGEEVSVEALVGPGHSPATFEPTAKQMARLQGSAAFISCGVPFERSLLARIANTKDSPPLFGSRPEGQGHHSHDHSHGIDPHTWLDPTQAMAMADTIGRVLAELSPGQSFLFHSRTLALKSKLQWLNDEVATILAPIKGQTFYVFHPAFGHFAQAFGLHQIAVEADGHEPGPRQLAVVIDKIKKDGARALIVQPQFSQKSAKSIARATGVEILVLDPLALQYDENLLLIANALSTTLSGNK